MKSLFTAAKNCLEAIDPCYKVTLSQQTAADWQQGQLNLQPIEIVQPSVPGRPAKPDLVPPRLLERRRPSTVTGRACLIHALAHIEFNAINLAWDAIVSFADMPNEYYADWVNVAAEEAYHFQLLRDHLQTLNYDYGDFPAHDGLWDMARKTADDVLVRMALVPRCLEARGLDANPAIRNKLANCGDQPGAEILDIILRDEIGHVAIGDRWFRYCCQQRQQEPERLYRALVRRYMEGPLRGPFHIEARRQAGFTDKELATLAEQT